MTCARTRLSFLATTVIQQCLHESTDLGFEPPSYGHDQDEDREDDDGKVACGSGHVEGE